ncbi:MAG: aminotransferase class I/II-fold pyridoxal phosphate-dependent enzyme, partial [Microcoleus sp.]
LTFIISLGNTESDIENLLQAFTILGSNKQQETRANKQHFSHLPPSPPSPLSTASPPLAPREAFFSPTETVAADKAVDRPSAELICPYPPGIPVLMPGEIITQTAVEYLQQIQAAGGKITGCSDPNLKTFKVVRQ